MSTGTEAKTSRAARRVVVAAGFQVGIASLLIVAIAVMANYLSFRHYVRWDWTSDRLFTLSSRTRRVVRSLPRQVTIYLFLSEADSNYADVRELLDRYRAEGRRLSVRHVDPDRNPAEYRLLSQRFGVRELATEGGQSVADIAAVVVSGKRRWTLTRDDLVSVDFGSMQDEGGPKVDVKAEQAMTGALVQVTSGRATQVCLTSGHGEWTIESGGERTLDALRDELRRDNVEMKTVATLGLRSVPEDCDAVFVIGPERAFSAEEGALLGRYLEAGGGLVLALDPVVAHDRVEPTGLESLTEHYGIRLSPSIVVERDAAHRLSPRPLDPFLVTHFESHPTTTALGATGGRVVVHVARGLVVSGSARPLLKTSEDAFAETRIEQLGLDRASAADTDAPSGAIPLAATAETGRASKSARKGRLVVVGDSDWLSPAFVSSPQFANFDLASAWTGWLTERHVLISIAPRKANAAAMTMTEEDLSSVFFRILVLMPAAVLLLGVAVWWSRRS